MATPETGILTVLLRFKGYGSPSLSNSHDLREEEEEIHHINPASDGL